MLKGDHTQWLNATNREVNWQNPSDSGAYIYEDLDGDLYGNPDVVSSSCVSPDGYVSVGGDCEDSIFEVNPGVDEVCDGTDNNCNDLIDDDDTTLDASSRTTFYPDSD